MKTTKTLRETLLSEIDSLVAGSTTHQRARAVASLAKATIATAQFELQHAAAVADKARTPIAVEL